MSIECSISNGCAAREIEAEILRQSLQTRHLIGFRRQTRGGKLEDVFGNSVQDSSYEGKGLIIELHQVACQNCKIKQRHPLR